MVENSYATVAQISDTVNQNNRYIALVKKLIQLEPNDWPKLHEQLKNLHLAELQTQPRPMSASKEKASETSKVKSPTTQQTNKQTLLLKHKLCPQKQHHRLNLTLTDR